MITSRRELTWKACDALARDGRKPSISSVREWTLMHHGIKRGSDTDTQADINAWYAELLASKQERLTVAGLPDAIADLARTLWVKATEAAAESLAAEREEARALVARAQEEVLAAQRHATEASEQTGIVAHQLMVVQESVKRLEEALAAARTSAAVAQERHAGQLQQRDDRIAALLQDISRRDVEHAARISDLESARKHALLQIDEARQQSRSLRQEAERVAAEAKAAAAAQQRQIVRLEAELGNASGKLTVMEARTHELEEFGRLLEERCHQLEERHRVLVAEHAAKVAPKKIVQLPARAYARFGGGGIRRRKL